jgi:hypothetical protein
MVRGPERKGAEQFYGRFSKYQQGNFTWGISFDSGRSRKEEEHDPDRLCRLVIAAATDETSSGSFGVRPPGRLFLSSDDRLPF